MFKGEGMPQGTLCAAQNAIRAEIEKTVTA